MKTSLFKNLAFNLALAATAVAIFTAAPVSGEALFSLGAIAGLAAIALSDYRTRRPLTLHLRARAVAVAAPRRVATLVAA